MGLLTLALQKLDGYVTCQLGTAWLATYIRESELTNSDLAVL